MHYRILSTSLATGWTYTHRGYFTSTTGQVVSLSNSGKKNEPWKDREKPQTTLPRLVPEMFGVVYLRLSSCRDAQDCFYMDEE